MAVKVLEVSDIDLEKSCVVCRGEGKIDSRNTKNGIYKRILCPSCSGAGFLTTSFGREILAFVKRHAKEIENI